MSRDSSPSFPAIDPDILRDHADQGRIDRGWERLERELTLGAPSTPARNPRASMFAAGLAAGFALALGGYGFFVDDDPEAAVVMAPAPVGSNAPEVMAAGAAPRSYALPGGGVITLEPGTIIDTVVDGQGEVRLRLVRGEATVTRGAHDARRLAVMVGDAEVVPAGGRTRVRHDGDTALFKVLDGSASVRSGGDGEQRVLGPDQEARVPTSPTTASREDAPRPGPAVVAMSESGEETDDTDDADAEPTPTASTPPEWMVACDKHDYETAAQQHLAAGGDMSSVDPHYLHCLSAGHQMLGDPQLAIAALEQIVNAPGGTDSGRRSTAAHDLARLHRKQGNLAEAAKYAELGNALVLPADRMCDEITKAANEKRVADFQKLSLVYLEAFPGGACIPIIAKFQKELAEAAAAAKADAADAASAADDAPEEPNTAGEDVYGEPEAPQGDE